MVVTAIGWRAHAALAETGGVFDVFARLSASVYATAAGEMIWIGPPGTPLHARSVAVPAAADLRASTRLAVDGVAPWRAAPLLASPDPTRAARILRETVATLGAPRGLARLLVAGAEASRAPDDVVLARARPHASALARACAADDAPAFAEAARPLLGLGTGLTPSGDDFVGGALFARRLFATQHASAWGPAVAGIVADAATLTHAISARLLADLAAGEGWAPLHDLAGAVVAAESDHGTRATSALRAAREVTALGHTSGWDIIAGFLSGLGGAWSGA